MSGSDTRLGRAAPGTPARGLNDLGIRALSGLVLIVISITSVRQGGIYFLLAWLLASAAVLWEWQRLVGGALVIWRSVIGAVALAAVALVAEHTFWISGCLVLVAAALIAVLAGAERRVWASSGMLYVGLFTLALFGLRFSGPFGIRALIWLFAVVWSTDVFAYFGGRLIGGPKLWPRISPSKTWAGTITGVAAGALIGTVTALRDLPTLDGLGPVLVLSFVVAVLSQCGDAMESAIKRYFGVKDSGGLIPGHGGVMDRLDGFIVATVFAFLVGVLRDQSAVASGLLSWV